ncbi:hypothetical protein FEM48_Zijuj07G0012000 [Ziziphus jujuba var. spinosa]|uniref:UDP-MurNAc-pentapeptide synthetase n=1 Tax=Ziziphus jujuba var. spinosa TaxID=714518 RepID=A0A978V1K6_ZIZJJ|nr:hypothetical protein FEM48_Zijuj07G0012000 [Ziziphus jujuba var. spinosa]
MVGPIESDVPNRPFPYSLSLPCLIAFVAHFLNFKFVPYTYVRVVNDVTLSFEGNTVEALRNIVEQRVSAVDVFIFLFYKRLKEEEAMTATPNPCFPPTQTFTKSTPPPKSYNSLSFPSCIKNTLKLVNSDPLHTFQDPGFLPLWTVNEIAQAVDGKIVKWGPPGAISTDTRTIQPNQWFFAITGENFDAHDFVTPVLSSKGCIGVIGKRVCENWFGGFVEISGNTIVSLTKMASYARNKFHGHVIRVTGSVEKTTTKAMIGLILENLGNQVYQSPGNWNNRIGVALSLTGIPRNAEVVVLEMGMNGKGEILELAKMARPTIRVVLNVGASHFENFSSLGEICKVKGEILVDAKAGDMCVLNADDPLVMSLHVPSRVKKVLFGRKVGCDVRLVVAESADGGHAVRVVLEKDNEIFKDLVSSLYQFCGAHLKEAAVATLLGVSLSQVRISLSKFIHVHMRVELEVARNGIKIINDAYNANPIGTEAALNLLKSIECKGKRVAILGDMLELCTIELESHKMVLNYCCGAGIDLIGLVGNRFLTAAENLNLAEDRKLLLAHDSKNFAVEISKSVGS